MVVSAPTATAPDGFLRKVVSTKLENGKTILETRQAKLTEAAQEGSFEETRTFSNTDIVSAELTSGVTLAPQGAVLSISQLHSSIFTNTPLAAIVTQSFGVVLQVGP